MEQSPDGTSKRQELRGTEDRRRANSVARAGGQVSQAAQRHVAVVALLVLLLPLILWTLGSAGQIDRCPNILRFSRDIFNIVRQSYLR